MVFSIIAAVIAVVASAGVYYQQKRMEAQAKKQAQEAKAVQVSGHDSNRGLYTVYGTALVGSTVVWKTVTPKEAKMTQTGFTTLSRATTTQLEINKDHGPNRFLYRAVTLCNGPITSVTNVTVDDEGYMSTRFGGHSLHFATTYSKGPAAGQNFSALRTAYPTAFESWGSTAVGKGVAYAIERLFLDPDNSAYQGEPQTRYRVQGRALYDPRKDSTSSAYDSSLGTSTHRAATPTTWEYSSNPVLALLDYLLNEEYGRGLDLSTIDIESIASSADKCDVLVDVPARLTNQTGSNLTQYNPETGITYVTTPLGNIPIYRPDQVSTGSQANKQKRFSINLALDPSKEVLDNIQEILNVFRGNLSYANGKYFVHMADVASPVLTLGDDDIIGGLKVANGDRSQRMNRATIKFINENKQSKTDQVSWPSLDSGEDGGRYATYLAEDEDEKLHRTFTIKGCTDYYQAQDTAEYLVRDSRSNLTVSGTFSSRCFGLVPGDVIALTYDSSGFSGKYFRVIQTSVDLLKMTVQLQLKEYDSSVYTWNASRANEPIGLSWQEEVVNAVPTSLTIGTIATNTRTRADGSTAITLTIPFSDVPDSAQHVEVSWAINGTTEYNTQLILDTENQTQTEVAIERDNQTYEVRLRYFVTNSFGTSMPSAYVTTTHVVPTLTGTKLDGVETGATVGAQVGVDLYNTDGSTVLGVNDVLNSVVAQDILTIEVEAGEVLDLETGADVSIESIGDVAIFVSNSNQTINTSINSVADSISALEDTVVDLTSGVSDIYIQTTEPVPGQNGIPNPIPTFSRFYDSDDNNHPYYYTGTAWVSLKDASIAQNSAAITNLTSNLATTNTTVAGNTTAHTANATAITALDTLTVSQGESITSIAADVTALEATVDDETTGVSATATGLTNLTTRVTASETATTSNATNITQLTSDLDQAELDIAAKASSTALTALDTRVTTAETTITSQSSSITTLTSDLDQAETDLAAKASTSALDTLTTRVSTAENTITTQTSDITALESTVDNSTTGVAANATGLSDLTTRVTNTENATTVNASDVTTLDATYTEDLHFRTKAEDENDDLIDLEDSGTLDLQDLSDFAAGSSSAVQALTVRTTASEDSLVTQANDITALKSTVNDPSVGVTATASGLSSLTTSVSVIDGSVSTISSDLTSLTTTVGGNSTSISTQSQSIDGVEANYGVKIDNNNRISGFGLLSTTSDSTPFSEFAVIADQFSIVDPSSTAANPIQPFTVTSQKVYFGTDVVISGDLVSTGTISADRLQIDGVTLDTVTEDGVTSLLIKSSGVDTAQIAESAITTARLSNDAVTVDKFANTLESTNYVADTSGWQILTSGNVEFQNAKITGEINATSGTLSSSIAIGTGDNIFKADSNGIYLGDAIFADAPFKVTPGGAVTATGVNITGTVDASTALTFDGANVTGTLAAGNLDVSGIITSGSLVTDSATIANDIRIGSGEAVFSADSAGIYLGNETFADAEFRVTPAGALTASSATLTGNVTASSFTLATGATLSDADGAISNAQQLMSAVTGVVDAAQHNIPSFWRITTDDNEAPSNSEFNTAAGRFAKVNDLVITTDTTVTDPVTPNRTYGWTCTTAGDTSTEAVWSAITNFMSGDLLVDGSVSADQINASSVASAVITAGSIVVENDLSDTTTIISGGNILTGTILADYIDVSGVITAGALITDSATIANDIRIGSGESVFSADSAGIYLGNTTFDDAEFRVSPAGALTASSATLTGNVTASTFTLSTGATLSDADGVIANADQVMSDVTGVVSADQHAIPSFWRVTTDDSEAPDNAEFNTVAGRLAKVNDLVISTDTTTTPDTTYAWVCTVAGATSTEATWSAISNFISGDLIVDGSVKAEAIAANAITAEKVSVTSLSAISADMGTITAGTIKTAATGYRVEVSDTGDFPIWYGTGTKTESNGLFYVKSDGSVYINAVIEAQAGSSIAVFDAAISFTQSNFGTSSSPVTVTSSNSNLSYTYYNGSGNYSYAWTLQATTSGNEPTISSTTIAQPTFSATVAFGTPAVSVWEVLITDTDTSAITRESVYVTLTNIGPLGGGG